MTVANINYEELIKNKATEASFKQAVAESVAEQAGHGLLPEHVAVTLSPGSVRVTAVITRPLGVSAGVAELQSVLESPALSDTLVGKIQAVPGIRAVSTGSIEVRGLSVSTNAGLPCSATPAAVCTTNSQELCLHDPSCSWHPPRRGGLGCNAGGVGQSCRFCGFKEYLPCDMHLVTDGPVCTKTPSPVCAGPMEPCYLDHQCTELPPALMGLGCNAGGMRDCRFCGFGPYPDCPKLFIA